MEKPITDELVNKHVETFNSMNRQVMGLHMIASALESRSKILMRDAGKSDTTDALDFNAKVIHEIAQNLKENLNKFADEENEMMECIEKQLKEINRRF
jgi:hypothetical protein